MEKAFAKMEDLTESIKEYVNNRMESVKLNVVEKSSVIIANVVAAMAVAVVLVCFIIFTSTALAFGLGQWIGSTWAGFLIAGCIQLLCGIVVWSARERIIRLPVMHSLVKQLFRDDDEQNQEH